MSTFASDFMDKFDARWDEVDVLIKMAEQIGTEDAKYNVLCRAAIVLVVANLEGCLQEIIRCLIDDININDAFLISSDRMKRTFCSQFIDRDSKNYEKKVTRMMDLFEQTNIKYTEEPFFYENNKNPKASVIEKYFEEIVDKNFWGYITDCNIERIFENDLEFIDSMTKQLSDILTEGVMEFPYKLDISKIEFNLSKDKVSDDCLWKTFLNQTLKARHNVAHGISFDNTMSIEEIKNTRDKIIILEKLFAVLIFKYGIKSQPEI